jgi:hypothetical protein
MISKIEYWKALSDQSSIHFTFISGNAYVCNRGETGKLEVRTYSPILMNCDKSEKLVIDKEVQWCLLHYQTLWDLYCGNLDIPEPIDKSDA